jgi:hypothetical protein
MAEVINANMEKNFFTYILENPFQFKHVNNFFFKNESIQFIYTIVKKEYVESKNVPSPQQMVDMIKLNDPENNIPDIVIRAVLKNDISEKKDWVEKRFRAWKMSNLVRDNTSKTIEALRNLDDIDIENVKSVISKIRNLYNDIPLMEEDEDDLGEDFDDPETHKQEISTYKIPTGWSSMDKLLSGGWDMSTLNILMGETNAGKCTFFDTIIRVKNKKTNKIQEIKIGDFYNKISKKC